MKQKDDNVLIIASKEKTEKKVIISCENDLTISTIEKIKDKIIDSFKKNEIVECTLKNVKTIDLTFIQLFYSMQISAKKLNKKLSFKVEFSEDMNSLLSDSDLKKIFV